MVNRKYIILYQKSRLTVRELINWQDDCYNNSSMNIFTLKRAHHEELSNQFMIILKPDSQNETAYC